MSKSIQITKLPLAMFSQALVKELNVHLYGIVELQGDEDIAVGPGQGTLIVVQEDEEFTYSLTRGSEEAQYVSGYIAFYSVIRRALSTVSWQAVEWLVLNYGDAFITDAISVSADPLTEDYLLDNIDTDGATGFRIEHITRYIEQGVTCKGDVLIREELHPAGEDDVGVAKLPICYPIIQVGDVLFFNQPMPTQHKVIGRMRPEDPLAPVSLGAYIYASLGVAEVEQVGPIASVAIGGEYYLADPAGVRPVTEADQVEQVLSKI